MNTLNFCKNGTNWCVKLTRMQKFKRLMLCQHKSHVDKTPKLNRCGFVRADIDYQLSPKQIFGASIHFYRVKIQNSTIYNTKLCGNAFAGFSFVMRNFHYLFLSADWLLLVRCTQSDKVVGGTLLKRQQTERSSCMEAKVVHLLFDLPIY